MRRAIVHTQLTPHHTHARSKPHQQVNFVIAHDGFTLADLVTYEVKRNEANGEQSRCVRTCVYVRVRARAGASGV